MLSYHRTTCSNSTVTFSTSSQTPTTTYSLTIIMITYSIAIVLFSVVQLKSKIAVLFYSKPLSATPPF